MRGPRSGYMVAALSLLVMSASFILTFAAFWVSASRVTDKVQSTAARPSVALPDKVFVPGKEHTPYRYSVVPGGVHSPEEFESAKADTVARAHYSGIYELAEGRTTKPTLRYVSFRKDNFIYWTRRQMTIPADEPVFVAARSPFEVRQRCGNLLSKTAQQPTLPEAEDKQISAELETPEWPNTHP